MKLMFDATILTNATRKNSDRSGIYFVAYQICRQIRKYGDVELLFWCAPDEQYLLHQVKEFRDVPVYPYKSILELYIDTIYGTLRKGKVLAKKNKQKFRKSLCHFAYVIMRLVLSIPHAMIKKMQPSRSMHKVDAFFSARECPPPEIASMPEVRKYIFVHDVIPFILPEYFKALHLENGWFKRLADYMKTTEDSHYFANSVATKNDFLKYIPNLVPKQITVVPLACSDSFRPCDRKETIKSLEKYGLPTDRKYVFSLCTLEPRKNLIRAVRAFVQFLSRNKVDDIVFILGGGHWDVFIEQLDAEISGIGDYRDRIIKAGYIDDEDLAPLYSGAEWFVYTSQYEGFGLPPLEAMACGCPVITSNNSSLPEVVGDAGIMIDWDSDEQHIKAYENCYYNPGLRNQMRERGLARAKEFSWRGTVDLMLKEICEGPNPLVK